MLCILSHTGFLARIGFLASLAVLVFSAAQTVAQEQLPADPDFEARIEQYLMQHPGVLRRALMNMQRWQETQQAEQQRLSLIHAKETFLKDPDLPVMGNPDGALMIVEFFDYHCGYCKRVFDEVIALTRAEPELKVVFLEFPILSDDSRTAALAALAAARQGRYNDIHAAFMTARGRLTPGRITEIAGDIGLDAAQLQTDMKDPALTEHLSRNRLFARQLGVSGTPAFIVADQVVPGANMARVRDLLAQAKQALKDAS